MIDAMEAEGTATDEWLLVTLVHDLGKVLLLTGEAPGASSAEQPVSVCAPGGGLDNCVFQWNHDEFAYSRLKDHLPDGGFGFGSFVTTASFSPPASNTWTREPRILRAVICARLQRYDHETKSPI